MQKSCAGPEPVETRAKLQVNFFFRVGQIIDKLSKLSIFLQLEVKLGILGMYGAVLEPIVPKLQPCPTLTFT